MIALLLVAAAILGHFALHLAIYNRINATGLQRKTIKRIGKLFLASCIAVPLGVALTIHDDIHSLQPRLEDLSSLPPVVVGYGVVCILSSVFFGLPWILWRPAFALEWVAADRTVTVIDVDSVVAEPLAISTKCKWEARIPGNQIFQLAVEQIELPVQGLPSALEGLRIAHLSDLHFTGDISAAFAKQVVEEANRWRPDLYVITGDIIDKQPCIAWLEPVFGSAVAKFGKFFVLGNHDLRVPDPEQTRDALQRCGWTDAGGKSTRIRIGAEEIEIIGNEFPWFPAPDIDPVGTDDAIAFRLLLSHSPDRIWWARRRGVKLMLAGHTHGGQGRLPFIGPLLSPSWHGSRFASGDFYKAPTTMHVSRGLGGVHLLRIHCRPELSLLTLRSASSDT